MNCPETAGGGTLVGWIHSDTGAPSKNLVRRSTDEDSTKRSRRIPASDVSSPVWVSSVMKDVQFLIMMFHVFRE